MKQAHLAGRTRGLRPSQLKQLERLSHRRHPDDSGAEVFTLERLAELALKLEETLHLLIDERGVCRLLWVGPLGESDRLERHLQGGSRRRSRQWRLISTLHERRSPELVPDGRDAVIALDVQPESWLRYQAAISRSGIRAGALWVPDPKAESGWSCGETGDLAMLCRCDIPAGPGDPRGEPFQAAQEHTSTVEQVLLLTLTGTDPARNERELAELEGLTRSAGARTVAVCRQRQGQINPQTLWGTGKLQEAALDIRKHGATLVITDRELTPVQARNLERLLDSPVMDRSELILDIFAQRASSAAGRLQVELAQLRYRLPRLAGRGLSLSRQGGGIGTRGPGETQLEKDKRAISRRIEHLGRELRQLGAHRARLRERRQDLPGVALVGYTNAGKSSLLNALCDRAPGGPVQAENILFATLDPTTRRLCLPREGAAPRELLITDTVGFIRELPAPLMQAFMATLEETRNADQLLLVVDLGDPDWQGQLKAVHAILDDLGCEQPRQVLANQIDRCHASALERIRELEPEALYLSATHGTGLKGLRTWLEQTFWEPTGAPPMVELSAALQNGDALITLAVLLLAVALFITGAMAPELVGLLSVALLMIGGVLTPLQALSGFGSPALITLMGLFAVSAALFRSGALDRLRELIASERIRSPRRMVGLLTLVVAPISGVVPNTPIVASLLPVLETWCQKRGIAPSRVLLPLSFATLLGGTLTLLGSSVNLLASDVSQQLGYGSLDLFSFSAIGVPVWLAGAAYMLLAPRALLPDRSAPDDQLSTNQSLTGYFTEVTIPGSSSLVGQTLRHSRLQRRFDVDVLELQRGGERILPPLADRCIEAEDRLLLRVTRADLLRLQQEHTIQLASASHPADNRQAMTSAELAFSSDSADGQKTVEVLLPAGSTLAGASLRELRFRQRHNATVLALRRGQQTVQERLGQAILREGDVLLLQAPLDAIRGLQASNDLLVLDQLENDLPTIRRKPQAITITALMLLVPTVTDIPLVAAVLLAVVLLVLMGCLRTGEVQSSIRLDVILLLGSLSSFSVALQTSGLANAMASDMERLLLNWPSYWALLVIFLSTNLITSVMSNAASVALLVPVATQLAPSLNLPPQALLLTVLFGASQSFLTPMGYQTNLMVFGPGRYRFFDVARYGGGLTLLMTLLVPGLILAQAGGN